MTKKILKNEEELLEERPPRQSLPRVVVSVLVFRVLLFIFVFFSSVIICIYIFEVVSVPEYVLTFQTRLGF